MAKRDGKGKQDAILARFKHDIKSTIKGAWQNALTDGEKNIEYRKRKAAEIKDRPHFIPSAPGFYGK